MTYGVFVDPFAPRSASVIHQHMKRSLLGGDLLNEPFHFGNLMNICGQSNAGSRAHRVQLFGGVVAVLGLARRDVHLA